MGHTIPVIFFPIETDRIPFKLETWHDAEGLLNEQVQSFPRDSYWVSSSRNWWHQDASLKVSERLDIHGLEFMQDEVVCLCSDDLSEALSGLDKLLQIYSYGVPDLGIIDQGDGTLHFLTHDIRNRQAVEFSDKEFRKAFIEAEPTNDVDEGSVIGYKALIGYFSFLKSLRQAIQVAIHKGTCLLYVMPQP
jgi:hypothetical protein